MIARCTTCEQNFETDTFGPQACPHCETQVHLVDPEAAKAPDEAGARAADGSAAVSDEISRVPSGDASGDAGTTRSAWETREVHGALGGYLKTVKQVLFHPAEVFATMTVADTRGAFSFAWISSVVGGVFAFFWGFVQWQAQSAQIHTMAGADPKVAEMMQKIVPLMDTLYGGLGIVILPVSALVGIFLMSGILHLMVMMVGANKRGFNATFRAYCFAQAPQLVLALPGCGGIVALVWSFALTGFALMHMHRCSGGKAAAAVLLVVALGCLCVCLAMGIVAASAAAAAGAM